MEPTDEYNKCGNCKDFPCDNSGGHLRWDPVGKCSHFNIVDTKVLRRYKAPHLQDDGKRNTDKRPNPFDGSTAHKVVKMIELIDQIGTITKTPPIKSGDTGRFHFPIKHGDTIHTIVLTTGQLLKGHGLFSTLYTDATQMRLYVSKTTKEWDRFINWVMEVAVPGEVDETPAVMASYQIFETIAHTMEATTDKKPLTNLENCNRLVEHISKGETWYVLPSSTVLAIINELSIKVTNTDISQAMTACNLKKANTALVKVEGTPIRCWWFSASKLKEYNPSFGVLK